MNENMSRRDWCVAILRGAATAGSASMLLPALAQASAPGKPTPITVYKDASCGCCKSWVSHLQSNGFAPRATDRTDMDALKDSLGVPAALRSCHTAIAGKYLIEGHVPAADIKRLLATAPAGVLGLAAPGMPAGSPGMEQGGRVDRYDVIAFRVRGGTSVFASHGGR